MSKTLERRLDQLEAQPNKRIIVAVTDTTLSGSGYRLSDGRHLSDSEFEKFQQSLGFEIELTILEICDNSKQVKKP